MEIHYLQGLHGDRALDYEHLIRLDEQLLREKNRADNDQINSLPTRKATAEDKEVRCCICMCDVEEGEVLRVLPCSHKYHQSCIDEWLTYNGCCPVDKKRIAPRRSRGRGTAHES
ncbi:E3 ubiquitin-protein ligase RNF38 [Gracilariopsis chorda]|uniref:E3 ubiquitin-protein ligase RNF38 n=1 Tax=Gracilariopsis chorda TaxID=448386 RepID=A0A2V3IK20_9FLOR|nr:E3 ubiquitin-protein ligase RNF38 [Gracilariopsis chorda]|eukprot:PXF42444.1 E3 ubiquitin-protein ligase RNF38 [Gracilariopsis chorda]